MQSHPSGLVVPLYPQIGKLGLDTRPLLTRLGHALVTPIWLIGHEPIPQLESVGHDTELQVRAWGHDPDPLLIRLGHKPYTPIRVIGHDPIPHLDFVGNDSTLQLGRWVTTRTPAPCAPRSAVSPFAPFTVPLDAENQPIQALPRVTHVLGYAVNTPWTLQVHGVWGPCFCPCPPSTED